MKYDNRLYFAYGSNLNLKQMLARCPTAVLVRPFVINDWRLVFRDVADIEPAPGSVVHGALYKVTPKDVKALDRYEGVKAGLYRQVSFRIRGTDEAGFFYRMNDDYIFPPSRGYYDTIDEGYLDWKLPISELELAREHAWDHCTLDGDEMFDQDAQDEDDAGAFLDALYDDEAFRRDMLKPIR